MSRGPEPVDTVEHAAFLEGCLPATAEIADGVYVVPVPFHSGQRLLDYTFCYVVADARGRAHLIDPGHGTEAGRALIGEALSRYGLERIGSIVVTHIHPDHLEAAFALADDDTRIGVPRLDWEPFVAGGMRTGGTVPDLDGWGVPEAERAALPQQLVVRRLHGARADLLLDDADLLPIPGRRIRAIATPGHTVGHMCFHDEDAGLLFSGDQVLPRLRPGLGLGGPDPENAVRSALDSLARIRDLEADQVCPGHEYRFRGLAERCDDLAAHYESRVLEVADVLERRPDASVWEIASRIRWGGGWEQLRAGAYLFTALRQTAMYADYVRGGAA